MVSRKELNINIKKYFETTKHWKKVISQLLLTLVSNPYILIFVFL